MSAADTLPAHSPLGASSAKRWMRCSGSVQLSAGLPDKSSVAAHEGTLAHSVAEYCLRAGEEAGVFVGDAVPGTEITCLSQDMADAVDLYIHTLERDTGRDVWHFPALIDASMMYVEHKFHLKDLHPLLFGTSDAGIWFGANRILLVYDYKHGINVPVDVIEDGKPNYQLTYYALGALLEFGLPAKTVEIVIVQPRAEHADGPVRRYRFDTSYLIDFADELVEAAQETRKSNAALVPGEHCMWCPARQAEVCPVAPSHMRIAQFTRKRDDPSECFSKL